MLDSFGNFIARCRNWWAGYANSNIGKEVDALTSIAGFTPLIDKSTHFISDGSSCIGLIFCNKPEIVSEFGITHSLFQTCHHNFIFAKIDVDESRPSNCSREVWDFKSPNVEGTQKSISLFHWEKSFEKLSTNEKVGLLNNTLY